MCGLLGTPISQSTRFKMLGSKARIDGQRAASICLPSSHRKRTIFKSSIPSANGVPPLHDHARNLAINAFSQQKVQDSVLVEVEKVQARLKTPFRTISAGKPEPLGPSKSGNGVNFAVYAKYAKVITLCLFDMENQPITEVPLDPSVHKTGDVWHVQLGGLAGSGVCYGYKVDGDGGWDTGHRWDATRVLLDPYAPLVNGRRKFGQRDHIEQFQPKLGSLFLGTYDFDSPAFDWGDDDRRRRIHPKDMIVYEMPVHSFTAHPSSGLPEEVRGTFLGVAEKAKYLASLGVTSVELLPVFEYDELEFQRSPNPRDHMTNIWGYSHINFFAPMSRFASHGAGPVAAAREFKEMVKRLHAEGLEVILDVVYNHTAEGGDDDPYLISFRGFDNITYYMLDMGNYVQLLNWSGCGNTVNANHPVVKRMIIDSLVHWVTEYHVDGFRFDLASCLCRDNKGQPLPVPPLIEAIAKHPLLSQTKLIAEPWDLGMYQVGSFPNWDVWSEWNGKYRDDVRRFIKGDIGMKGAFATRLAGSSDLYQVNKRKPYHGINFIVAHDGFSLYDLVSYNEKHNDANGEMNRDGSNDNLSWNCGVEGPTSEPTIHALRLRQVRNFMLALMLSQGTPMIVMGDEVLLTHHGNNNWYGHDVDWTQYNWQETPESSAMFRFMSLLMKFRRAHPALGQERFLGPSDITWHEDNWGNLESRFLACTIHDPTASVGDLYAAFNAHTYKVMATLPAPPTGKKWVRVADTNLPSPRDITPEGSSVIDGTYGVEAFSAILLIAK